MPYTLQVGGHSIRPLPCLNTYLNNKNTQVSEASPAQKLQSQVQHSSVSLSSFLLCFFSNVGWCTQGHCLQCRFHPRHSHDHLRLARLRRRYLHLIQLLWIVSWFATLQCAPDFRPLNLVPDLAAHHRHPALHPARRPNLTLRRYLFRPLHPLLRQNHAHAPFRTTHAVLQYAQWILGGSSSPWCSSAQAHLESILSL